MKIFYVVLFALLGLASCKDACDDITCDKGDCSDGICNCDRGYEGTLCDTEARTKFLGTWKGVVNCTDNTFFDIEVENTTGEEIWDLDMGLYGNQLNTTGTVDGDKVSYSQQMHSGTLTADGSILRAEMMIANNGGTISDCSGVLDRM